MVPAGYDLALFAAFFSQPLLLLVVGGAVHRASDKTLAPDMAPGCGVTAYFVILLAALAYLAYLASLAPLGVPAR